MAGELRTCPNKLFMHALRKLAQIESEACQRAKCSCIKALKLALARVLGMVKARAWVILRTTVGAQLNGLTLELLGGFGSAICHIKMTESNTTLA